MQVLYWSVLGQIQFYSLDRRCKTCLDTKPVLYQDRFCSLTNVNVGCLLYRDSDWYIWLKMIEAPLGESVCINRDHPSFLASVNPHNISRIMGLAGKVCYTTTTAATCNIFLHKISYSWFARTSIFNQKTVVRHQSSKVLFTWTQSTDRGLKKIAARLQAILSVSFLWKLCSLISTLMTFAPKDPIDHRSAQDHPTDCRQTGNRPSPEQVLTQQVSIDSR